LHIHARERRRPRLLETLRIADCGLRVTMAMPPRKLLSSSQPKKMRSVSPALGVLPKSTAYCVC
jgi:hypothetical protein